MIGQKRFGPSKWGRGQLDARERISVRLREATDEELEAIDALIAQHLADSRHGGQKVATGDRLRQLRLERGWSQGHMARKCGFSQSALQKWETGKTSPRGDHKLALIAFGFTEEM